MKQSAFKVHFQDREINAFYITERDTAVEALEKLNSKPQGTLFGIDTETMKRQDVSQGSALSPILGTIRLIQVADGKSAVVFDRQSINDDSIFIPFLENHRFVAHNAIFDLQFFMQMGVRNMEIGCSMILTRLVFHATYPTDEGLSASLANMIKTVFNIEVPKDNQASNWGATDLTAEQIRYSALDGVYVLELAKKLAPALDKFGLTKTYKLLKDAQHPIAAMQLNGFKVDPIKHRESIAIWRDKLYTCKKYLLKETKLDKITAHTMSKYLYNTLDAATLDKWPITAEGKLQTDAHTFADFSYLPIVKPFSEYQKREKLTSSFGMRMLSQINPVTKRLHPSFNLTGARTGRLSCSKPNLQQLPRSPKEELKNAGEPDVRENFVAEEGYVFICADYSQIELRVAAELSRDPVMLKAYRDGEDLHKITAANVAGIPVSKVSKEQRQAGKAFNFGLLFGLGANKFSHYALKSYGVKITKEKAIEDVRAWHELFEGYTKYQQRVVREARKTFKVRTPGGKLRALATDAYYGPSLNHAVQGGAAEVMLHALIKIDNKIKEADDGMCKLVNVVHDEIILECVEGEESYWQEILEDCMVDAYKEIFPGGIIRDLVESHTGKTWAEAK